jgi:pyridoxine 5-phosphate synthase
MIKLSVNINKIATIRNSRGGNTPSVREAAINCQRFGADGITVHPRPDERHIRYQDVSEILPTIKTEFNIEGNPRVQKFIDLVLETKPHQVTLVPDADGQLTSDHGWDTIIHKSYLTDIIAMFKSNNIRTSVFVDPNPSMIEGARLAGADRIELYTERYAQQYTNNKEEAIRPFIEAADHATKCGLGINAGHDLNLENLNYFALHINSLLEVSIGHALISDALYFGLENTIQLYKRQLHV